MTEWLDELLRVQEGAVPAALVTVVHVVGSTPREAGARMIVYRDGRQVGTIGGGCGEAQVRQAALDALDTGEPRLLSVDLRGSYGDDAEVCGGRMEVFVEPIQVAARAEEAAIR